MKKSLVALCFLLGSPAFSFSILEFGFDQGLLGETRYQRIKRELTTLAQLYPDNAKLFELGISDSGEQILGIRLGKGPINDLMVATHHGNEYGSTEVALAFAQNVAKDPIQGRVSWVVPVLNISGYNANTREEVSGGRSHDPNRDYPGPCGTSGPHNLKSTRLLVGLMEKVPFVMSATLHTFFPGALYPWGISTRDTSTEYDADFIELGKKATFMSSYAVGNSTDLLYPADGTFEDFSFWHYGIWSMLFELGYSHSPSGDQIQKMIAQNVPGLRRMFAEGPVVNAPHHNFSGKCDVSLKALDRHDE